MICQSEDQGKTVPDQWQLKENVAKLVPWLWNHYVVRTDCYANYNLLGKPSCVRDRNDPDAEDGGILARDVLSYHCRGEKVVGVYTTEPLNHTCKWMTVDIDAHIDADTDSATAAAIRDRNFKFAVAVWDHLRALGFDPLLTDSNGKGGYHITVFFSEMIPARVARSFGLWLTKDHDRYGLADPVEVFPKQGELKGEKKIGNQVRLPGRHHKRDHWSRVWDGTALLEGTAAINEVCRERRGDPAAIPAEAEKDIPPARDRKLTRPETWESYQGGSAWPSNYSGDLRTLDVVKLFTGERLYRRPEGDHHAVVCPWAGEHTTGDDGTAVWAADGTRFPRFNCMHAHCQGRKLEHVLSYFGKDKVDAACGRKFGNPEKLKDDHEHREREAKVADVVKGFDPADLDKLVQHADHQDREHKTGDHQGDDQNAKYAAWEEGKKATRRRGYRLAELKTLPPVRYLIKGHIPTNSLSCLYGPSGAGKSFVAIDMAMSVATGLPYLGAFDVRPGPVVYMSGEGVSGIGRRFDAWCSANAVGDPGDLLVVPHPFDLTADPDVGELLDLIRADLGADPVVVFVDTVARYFGASDENSTRDMGAFVRGCDMIRRATGAAVVLVHHTGKDPARGERGNSSLRAACDTLIEVEDTTTPTGPGSLIGCSKQKDGAPFDSYIVGRKVVPVGVGDDGEEVTSCVLVAQQPTATRYQLLPATKKKQLAALNTKYGAAPFGPTDAVQVLEVSKSTAGEVLKYLSEKKLIDNHDGRYTIPPDTRNVLPGVHR